MRLVLGLTLVVAVLLYFGTPSAGPAAEMKQSNLSERSADARSNQAPSSTQLNAPTPPARQMNLQSLIGKSVQEVERTTGCRAEGRETSDFTGSRKSMSLDCRYNGGSLSVGFNAKYRKKYNAVYGRMEFEVINPDIRASAARYEKKLSITFEKYVEEMQSMYGPFSAAPCWSRRPDMHGCVEACLSSTRYIQVASYQSGEFAVRLLDYALETEGYRGDRQPSHEQKKCGAGAPF